MTGLFLLCVLFVVVVSIIVSIGNRDKRRDRW